MRWKKWKFMQGHELVQMPAYLAVCGESFIFGLTRLKELRSGHLTFDWPVLHRAPSRHVILYSHKKNFVLNSWVKEGKMSASSELLLILPL